jgi:hypothetical protein
VICSGVGGMAEKVTEGVDGLHFRMGDSRHLAARMIEAATTPGLRQRLAAGITPPQPMDAIVDAHIRLYEGLVKTHRGRGAHT